MQKGLTPEARNLLWLLAQILVAAIVIVLVLGVVAILADKDVRHDAQATTTVPTQTDKPRANEKTKHKRPGRRTARARRRGVIRRKRPSSTNTAESNGRQVQGKPKTYPVKTLAEQKEALARLQNGHKPANGLKRKQKIHTQVIVRRNGSSHR